MIKGTLPNDCPVCSIACKMWISIIGRFFGWEITGQNVYSSFLLFKLFAFAKVLTRPYFTYVYLLLRPRSNCMAAHYAVLSRSLWKHAYSNILKILPQKNENFQIKNTDVFHTSAQNIDCGYSLELPHWGSSNEYPQSMFWVEIRKIMHTPVNPSFTI